MGEQRLFWPRKGKQNLVSQVEDLERLFRSKSGAMDESGKRIHSDAFQHLFEAGKSRLTIILTYAGW
jgi:hypothetical protein